MSYLKKIGALFVSSALMASMLAGCGGSSSGSPGDSGSQAEGGDGNYNISIVFKTTSNEYTQYMMAGAEKAAAETGAVLDMKGATSEPAYGDHAGEWRRNADLRDRHRLQRSRKDLLYRHRPEGRCGKRRRKGCRGGEGSRLG